MPFAVGQVREAAATTGIGAVTLGAVLQEQTLTHFQGFRILGDLGDGTIGFAIRFIGEFTELAP